MRTTKFFNKEKNFKSNLTCKIVVDIGKVLPMTKLLKILINVNNFLLLLYFVNIFFLFHLTIFELKFY